MTDPEFEFLRDYLKARSGLSLGAEKRYLVESRLTPLCRKFNQAGLRELIGALRLSRDAGLERAVVEAMTTNETFFFRDRAPFDLFRDVLLPRALTARAAARRLRIWCAATSTGQEPYSLAMLLQEVAPKLTGWSVDIVATDLSTEVLERARAGLYSHFEVQRGLPAQLLVKHFTQIGDQWRIDPALARGIDFKPLNLLQPFEHLGQFDIVFCRNVLIYFDAPTKTDVLNRIARMLAPDGALLLGAAETVIGLTSALMPDGTHRGLYRKGVPASVAEPSAAGTGSAPAAMMQRRAVGY